MEPGTFREKAQIPDAAEVAATLGKTFGLWTALRAALHDRLGSLDEAWKFSGKQYGWSLQLSLKKRAVVYLTPCPGFFRASFAFSDQAVAAARQSDLPAKLIEEIESAQKYLEGRPVRVEVRKKSALDLVLKLATIKLA
ncbi:MAG: DUF3788 family protein [Myxococcales bacterium]|nr:DUF3788 family protein [Myxococcales bacterium]